MPICAKIEEDVAEIEKEEKKEFLAEFGLTTSGLDNLIKESYTLLGLISYLTAGPEEVRAWTIKQGSTAPEAAGAIHTDFQKGFIAAQVCKYDDLVRLGSEKAVREAGLLKTEGKDYIVQEGDVIEFRFNV